MSKNTIIKLDPNPKNFEQNVDELEAGMFDSSIPVQHTHMFYENDDIGLYIGLWDTMDMTEKAGPYGCDEFMWLLDGECEIKGSSTDNRDLVKKGEAFIIPKGYDCQWIQKGYLRKYFVISEHPDESIPSCPSYDGIIKPENLKDDNFFQDVKFDEFVSINDENSEQHSKVCYSNADGKFKVVNWQSSAFKSNLSSIAMNLFVIVIEGSIEVIDNEGDKQSFTAEDAFFISEGSICSCSSEQAVKLIYTAVKN